MKDHGFFLIMRLADGSCCLLELPIVEEDGAGVCRYRCKTCHHAYKFTAFDRLPGRKLKVSQINLVWKHVATNEHFNAHLHQNPITEAEKRKRVLEVIPKLRDILSRKQQKSGRIPPKLYFTSSMVQELIYQLEGSTVDAAYYQAFKYGMQGNFRGAKPVEAESGCSMAPQNLTAPSMPVTMDFLQQTPTNQANQQQSELDKMFSKTQQRSSLFRHPAKPKS